MNKAPAFQFYANDWLSSTKITLMTPAQEGAYIRLLCIAWNDPECSLPDDDEALSVLSRLGEGWFNGGSVKVRACFEPHPTIPGKLVNIRLLEERQKQQVWREKSRQGGINSGKARQQVSDKSTTKQETKGGSTVAEKSLQPNANQRPTLLSSSSKEELSTNVDRKPRKSSPSRKQTDPRTAHPAIQAFLQVKGKFPPKERYDAIIEVMGEAPDVSKLLSCRQEWVARGYNGESDKWVTEWYKTGIPEQQHKGNNVVRKSDGTAVPSYWKSRYNLA